MKNIKSRQREELYKWEQWDQVLKNPKNMEQVLAKGSRDFALRVLIETSVKDMNVKLMRHRRINRMK